ncbi:thioesterase family protein [Terrilactibacillus sp. S3-3]|nr:thioesterase family protein [Terrilactibacillus sp. S3-3]
MISKTRIVARYCETDQMGIVHHSQYVNWFEVARTDWIHELGQSYRQIEEAGLMLPVIGVQLQYRSPARYDDAVIVETRLKEYNSIRIVFEYHITRKSGWNACLLTGRHPTVGRTNP